MDKAKELSKNPFKIKNKFEKELVVINKILDNNKKTIESERDEKLLEDIEKLLLKTKDGIQSHIRGNVLKSLGYEDLATLFFNKAIELGYIVNENIEAQVQEDTETEDTETEDNIKDSLIDKTVTKITNSDNDTQLVITDVLFEIGNIVLKLNDETTDSFTYNEIDKLLNGFQVVKMDNKGKYYALMLENPVTEKKINENMEMTQEQLNDIKSNLMGKFFKFEWSGFFDTDSDSITDVQLENNMAVITTTANMGERVSIVDLIKLSNGEQINTQDSQGEYVGIQIVDDNGIVENCEDVCKCEEGNCKCENVNEDYELNMQIGDNILDLFKDELEAGTFTAKQLEEHILNNGGTSDMIDDITTKLVAMGYDLAIENDNSLFDIIINKYQLSELLQNSLKTVLNDYESSITVDERDEAINAIAALVDDDVQNIINLLSDNLISNENFKQTLPLAEELKNVNLFGIDLPETDKKDYDPDTVFNVINSDPFLKFSYHELNTGDFEKDMEMIYKTYIKDNDELVSKMATMESYIGMLKENAMSKSPNINIIDMILNKHNMNPENYKNEIYQTESDINVVLQSVRNRFTLLTPDFKTTFRDKMNDLSAIEISDKILTSGITFNHDVEENVTKLSEIFGFNDDLTGFNINNSFGLFIYNLLAEILEIISTEDMEFFNILFVAVSAIVLKAL